MANQTDDPRTEAALDVLIFEPAALRETQAATRASEVEHIRPEHQDRLAPLESDGLLAVGVRLILEENGFTQHILREHCGCPVCAQRCSLCDQRLQERA